MIISFDLKSTIYFYFIQFALFLAFISVLNPKFIIQIKAFRKKK